MDLRGRPCTLYPISAQGAGVMPTGFDFTPVAQAYMGGLVADLSKAGLNVLMPVVGAPDQGLSIRGQIVRADPGSRLMRYLFTWFAGAAVFEAEGQFGEGTVLIGSFHAKGTRRAGFGGGDSQKMLIDAARLAGQQSAGQILAVLATHQG